ncbi:MAG TPA: C40 family peptidase [Dyadobacter sp.]|jgi:cell wall-associated NlpC family hydrolase|nr:C40 family peptidase [Dyadobacter sp.]
MTRHLIIYLSTLFIFTLILSSCDTLRKGPSNASAARPGSYSSRKNPRSTAGRAPARKPAATSRSTPAKPTYTRPSGSYNTEVPRVVEVARTYWGTPYRSGGNDKNGIDCSGLICSVYSEIGVKVPRISWQQSEFGSEVGSIKELKPGDWVFFVPEAGKEGYVSHAGIITDVRNNDEIMFIHASTSKGVREDNLFSNYFKGRFVKAMRPF